jgi:hypothetical protein
MKRAETIEKLIKEGFSEKTLVKFNDNQLKKFADKILKEAQTVTTTKTIYTAGDPKDKAAVNAILDKAAHDPSVLKDKNIEVKEDAEDVSVKKDKKKKGKVALNLKNINEFVNNVVDKKYHTMTTKSEIIEMIKSKMNTIVSEDLTEKKLPKLPEFMSFDSIVSAGKPEEAPAQPEVIPDTPTRETPKREDDPRRRPFRNPNEEPAADPDPKAKIRKIRRPNMSMAAE